MAKKQNIQLMANEFADENEYADDEEEYGRAINPFDMNDNVDDTTNANVRFKTNNALSRTMHR